MPDAAHATAALLPANAVLSAGSNVAPPRRTANAPHHKAVTFIVTLINYGQELPGTQIG